MQLNVFLMSWRGNILVKPIYSNVDLELNKYDIFLAEKTLADVYNLSLQDLLLIFGEFLTEMLNHKE